MKYLEFSNWKQITLTGYFRCHSEPPSKNLRSKHSCLWYKIISSFHFVTGTWFMWGTLSKARKQTLKDHLTFFIFFFPDLVLKTAPSHSFPADKLVAHSCIMKLHWDRGTRTVVFPDWVLQTHSLVWICADEQKNQKELAPIFISTININERVSVNTVVYPGISEIHCVSWEFLTILCVRFSGPDNRAGYLC